ncbi:MAG: SpoIIE family protein phosphatase [candidate division Zixibacteria bacterium]|nr:SpoIIE family protein phosphatase [candidate division Zixibacteria bacterium]
MNWQILIAVFYLVLAAVLIWLGTVIYRENRRSRVNRITALMLVFAGLGPAFASIGSSLPVPSGSTEYSSVTFPYSLFYLWELFFPQLLLFSFVFPVEHPWVSRFRRTRYMIFLPHVFHVLWMVFLVRPHIGRMEILSDSTTLQTVLIPVNLGLRLFSSLLTLLLDFHVKFFSLINLVYYLTAIGMLRRGYKAVANPRIRDQVRTILRGISLAVGLYALAFIAPALSSGHLVAEIDPRVRIGVTIVALLVGAGSIAWSIVRHQFLDIRLIVRQSVVFTVSSALLVGLYLLLLTKVSTFVKDVLEVHTPLVDVAFVIVVLMFFQPLKERVDDLITRLFLRDRADPRAILEAFSQRVASVFEVSDLKRRMILVLTEQMFVERAFFAVRDESATRFRLELAGLEGEAMAAADDFFAEALRRGRSAPFESFVLDRPLTPMTELLTRWGCRLVVPIIDRGVLSAVLLLGDKVSGYRYSVEDVNLLSTLANQFAVAMTNAGLYREALEKQKLEDELHVARQIQMRLLPRQLPSGPYFNVAAFSKPSSQVGGDYYDFFELPGGRLGLVIADVSGKGLGAALLVSQLQAILRSEVRARRSSVAECVANANVLIAESTSPEQFATLVFAEFDPSTHRLTYANAGHNYPIVVSENGTHTVLDCGGLVLGVMPQAEYAVGEVSLSHGDAVLFYTDGLSDLQNLDGEDFGEGRILALLRENRHLPAEALKDEMVRHADHFASGELGFDDLTLMVLKIGAATDGAQGAG